MREVKMVKVICDNCGNAIVLRGDFGACPTPSEVTQRIIAAGWNVDWDDSNGSTLTLSDTCPRCYNSAKKEDPK